MQEDFGGTGPALSFVSALKPKSLERHTQQDAIEQPGNRQPLDHESSSRQSQKLGHVFKKDSHVRKGASPY